MSNVISKKIASLIISFSVGISSFAFLPLTVSADENDDLLQLDTVYDVNSELYRKDYCGCFSRKRVFI